VIWLLLLDGLLAVLLLLQFIITETGSLRRFLFMVALAFGGVSGLALRTGRRWGVGSGALAAFAACILAGWMLPAAAMAGDTLLEFRLVLRVVISGGVCLTLVKTSHSGSMLSQRRKGGRTGGQM
jgi:hypothetical protein